MEKHPKYTRDFHINQDYIDHIEKKLKKVELVVKWVNQSNGVTNGDVCISALKNISRYLI